MDKTTLLPSVSTRELSIGVALGVVVGATFGIASNNIALGLSFGAIMGVALGGVLNWYNNHRKSKSSSGNRRWAVAPLKIPSAKYPKE